MIRAALILLTALALSGCAETRNRMADIIAAGEVDFAGDPVTLAELADEPGVFAGRLISVPGEFSMMGGQACLTDRGRAIAIRLSPEQYALYAPMEGAPVVATGEFSQTLCPRGSLCPNLCARAGFTQLEDIQSQ